MAGAARPPAHRGVWVQVIVFLKKKDEFVGLVLRHLGTSALMDLLLRLVSCVEPAGLRQDVLRVSGSPVTERLRGCRRVWAGPPRPAGGLERPVGVGGPGGSGLQPVRSGVGTVRTPGLGGHTCRAGLWPSLACRVWPRPRAASPRRARAGP